MTSFNLPLNIQNGICIETMPIRVVTITYVCTLCVHVCFLVVCTLWWKWLQPATILSHFTVHTSRYILWSSLWACRALNIIVIMAATATVTVTVGKGLSVKWKPMKTPNDSTHCRVGRTCERKLADTWVESDRVSGHKKQLCLRSYTLTQLPFKHNNTDHN